jgi:hypothetical protein
MTAPRLREIIGYGSYRDIVKHLEAIRAEAGECLCQVRHRARPLGGHGCARHLPPKLKPLGHFLVVLGGRKQVASRSEMRSDGTVG